MKQVCTTIVMVTILALSVTSCREEKEGPAEKAGKQIDKAIEKAKESLK